MVYLFSEIVLSGSTGTWLVWWVFPIAEALSVMVSVVFMKRINKQKINVIGE
ncbi:MAG: hypothetical protein IKT67_05000 [Lachnospiraceae bacterium]|nr:hypothetical protein [Lachnospiraceae bacterium]